MKLKDLKTGQQFKFAEGHKKNKGTFVVLKSYPSLVYSALNGHTHYKPKSVTIPESKVLIVGEPPETLIKFTDLEGDTITVDAGVESAFIHVTVKYTFQDKQSIAVAALDRDKTLQLISFLETQLLIKQ